MNVPNSNLPHGKYNIFNLTRFQAAEATINNRGFALLRAEGISSLLLAEVRDDRQ